MGSLKYHLFMRFLTIIILQIAFVGLFAWFYFADSFQQSIDENFKIVSSIKQSIENFYQHQVDEFQRLSQGKAFRPYRKAAAYEVVKNYLDARGIIATIHYYLPNGDLDFFATSKEFTVYSPEKNVSTHREPKFREIFEKVIKEKKTIFTPPLYTKVGAYYQVALIPVNSVKNDLQGVLSLAFFSPPNRQNNAFKGLSLSDENFLVMADADGNIITADNILPKDVGPSISHYILHRGPLPSNPYNYVRKELEDLKYSVNGNSYYLLSRRIGELPLFVIIGINEKILLSQKKRLLEFILSITGISTLIGLLASILVSQKAVKGTEEILEAIKELRLGRTHKKKNTKLHREFDDALNELDELSIEIQKGKLLGNLWGQDSLSRNAKKDL